MAHRRIRSSSAPWVMLLALAGWLASAGLPQAQAQTTARYFAETGHFLGGAFRYFWETNGGLENFGYPITEEYTPAGGGRLTQYFERARFELVEQGGQATVDLGKLGVEVTNGRVFPRVPPIETTADRRYIPQTQHIIKYGFKEIWETRGAERIFGFPISEEIFEVLEDGEWHTVQYFERARFEYWPDFPPGKRVLLSNLGRRLAPPELLAPVPPSSVPGGPVAIPGGGSGSPAPTTPLPASVNARVVPDSGPPGTVFKFEAQGFQAGEKVGIWLTAPDQSTIGAKFQAEADRTGSIAGENIALTTDQSFANGIWSFNAQGVKSKKQAIGYFRIDRAAAMLAPGDPARLGAIIHDQLPTRGSAFVVPLAAPPGYRFVLSASGYQKGEQVSAWITKPDGSAFALDESAVRRGDDGTAQVTFTTAGLPEGIYSAVAQGVKSGTVNAAAFKLTREFVAGPGTPRPANANGSVSPAEGGQGATFQIRGQGLRPGEQLEFWVTDPTGAYILFPATPSADSQGRIGYDPPLDLTTTAEATPGVFGFHFRGKSSGVRVDVYFTYTGSARAMPGPGGHLWVRQQLPQAWRQNPGLIRSSALICAHLHSYNNPTGFQKREEIFPGGCTPDPAFSSLLV